EKRGVVFDRRDGRDPHGGGILRWTGTTASACVRHVQEQLQLGIVSKAGSRRCTCVGLGNRRLRIALDFFGGGHHRGKGPARGSFSHVRQSYAPPAAADSHRERGRRS